MSRTSQVQAGAPAIAKTMPRHRSSIRRRARDLLKTPRKLKMEVILRTNGRRPRTISRTKSQQVSKENRRRKTKRKITRMEAQTVNFSVRSSPAHFVMKVLARLVKRRRKRGTLNHGPLTVSLKTRPRRIVTVLPKPSLKQRRRLKLRAKLRLKPRLKPKAKPRPRPRPKPRQSRKQRRKRRRRLRRRPKRRLKRRRSQSPTPWLS